MLNWVKQILGLDKQNEKIDAITSLATNLYNEVNSW